MRVHLPIYVQIKLLLIVKEGFFLVGIEWKDLAAAAFVEAGKQPHEKEEDQVQTAGYRLTNAGLEGET